MWFFKITIFGAIVAITSGQFKSEDDYTETGCRPGLCEQLCFDTYDGFDCRCKFGFYRNPSNTRSCLPINPNCQSGYQQSKTDPRICEDIDECKGSNDCEQLCINTIGSYRCGCRYGYYINTDNGKTCIDMDNECAAGYAANPRNNSYCGDIDECERPGLCEQNCINLQGSYRCTCFSGYHVSGAENSKCQEIEPCSAAVDVLFVVDSTNSMGYNNFQIVLSFAAEVVRHFEIGNSKGRFGVLLFSDSVETLFGLNEYKTVESITETLLTAEYLGGVAVTNEVFDFIRENNLFSTAAGGRSNALDTVVLFTDDRSTNPDLTRVAAENLKNSGVKIIVVGIGDGVSKSELSSVASTPDDFIHATDFEHIDYIQEELDWRICPEAGSVPRVLVVQRQRESSQSEVSVEQDSDK